LNELLTFSLQPSAFNLPPFFNCEDDHEERNCRDLGRSKYPRLERD
jgi:hypothetical protein